MAVTVKDQDCPTNATNADFFVSSMGELNRGREFMMEVNSLDAAELARRLGFDWNKVCLYVRANSNAEARRWFAAIDAEWERLYRQNLTKKEHNLVKKVLSYQECVSEVYDRFRVYGELRNGKHRIVVVTEFIGFIDDDDYWTRFNAMVKKLKASIWIMQERDYLNHWWDLVDGKQTTEHFGENHGRMERQVELSWRIERLTIPEMKALMVRIRNATQKLWNESGVGVI